jgi:uncharacterized protein YeaO (DUF488 family)
VRRPPRGVKKSAYATEDWYDAWLPELSPSAESVKLGLGAATPAEWKRFVRRYRAEMAKPGSARLIALLAALSHQADFSVGCYCEDASRCHRSVLRELLEENGAKIAR